MPGAAWVLSVHYEHIKYTCATCDLRQWLHLKDIWRIYKDGSLSGFKNIPMTQCTDTDEEPVCHAKRNNMQVIFIQWQIPYDKFSDNKVIKKKKKSNTPKRCELCWSGTVFASRMNMSCDLVSMTRSSGLNSSCRSEAVNQAGSLMNALVEPEDVL